MGYYTGNGVTAGGGSDVGLKETIEWVTRHNIYQRTTSTVTVKNGVSLQTAQAAQGSLSLNDQVWTSGGSHVTSLGCKGSSSSASYSRVGDSNLYTLSITNNAIQVMNASGWSPTGWQS